MQRALSTHLLAGHRLNTIWLDRIWNAGIPLVEIFCARQHLDYRSKSQLGEIASWFGDAELKLHSVHAPIFSDDCSGRSGPAALIDISEVSKPKRIMHVDEIKRAIEIADHVQFTYLIQHLGVAGQPYDETRIEAAFNSIEELSLFAAHRGVKLLLENIPSSISSAERLAYFVNSMHLDIDFCFDLGHANLMEGVEHAFSILGPRIRSTHVHDNNGKDDRHLFPMPGLGGTIDWPAAMRLLRTRDGQFPLLLELKDPGESANPLDGVREIFEKLESL
ncbi:MAG TPA: sugar phosphate isomerase/epimerase family protein [Bryobacteraceae bacterium]|nr:sugar phosphate isomerase/epimerase family protein [Bryobacteraceae bacterium]HPT25358.1 sugar phosphate isomerase/epimerase family protein [Bryobacteraceae bacterium]